MCYQWGMGRRASLRTSAIKARGARAARGFVNMSHPEVDRRQYKRVKAPIYFHAARFRLFGAPTRAQDVSSGGIRIYSDDPVKIGERLDLEMFLPDHTSIKCSAEVVWVEQLPPGSAAVYDVGMRFVALTELDRESLAAVLEEPLPESS